MSEPNSYRKAGVDVEATDAVKRAMAGNVDRGDPRVLNRFGAFASLLEGRFPDLAHPVLVMKTEEPGSKQKLAFELGAIECIAQDLIHHLVNDVTVLGAHPLYVQDCIVCGSLEPQVVTRLVAALAEACRRLGCVLCGGETSVQPGVLAPGAYVLSASAVGVVDGDKIIDGSRIAGGDVLLALASSGLHTNGYTLVRHLLAADAALGESPVGGESFLAAVMKPHRCYYPCLRELFGDPDLRGLAHITGGGLAGNLRRILPPDLDARVDLSCLEVPAVFGKVRTAGRISEAEMLRTFNLGVGLVAVCAGQAAQRIRSHAAKAGVPGYRIGDITAGAGQVRFSGRIQW